MRTPKSSQADGTGGIAGEDPTQPWARPQLRTPDQGAARGSCSIRTGRQLHEMAGGGGGLDTQGYVPQTQAG